MRRSEITPELIELSKKAKELGFPQDVEEGDWICWEPGGEIDLELHLFRHVDGGMTKAEYFILSFSRCLEWLQGKLWFLWSAQEHNTDKEPFGVMVTRAMENGVFVWSDDCPEHCIYEKAKTHHEAIAKAVVKILEEKEDG